MAITIIAFGLISGMIDFSIDKDNNLPIMFHLLFELGCLRQRPFLHSHVGAGFKPAPTKAYKTFPKKMGKRNICREILLLAYFS
jgi:hypothetical protein